MAALMLTSVWLASVAAILSIYGAIKLWDLFLALAKDIATLLAGPSLLALDALVASVICVDSISTMLSVGSPRLGTALNEVENNCERCIEPIKQRLHEMVAQSNWHLTEAKQLNRQLLALRDSVNIVFDQLSLASRLSWKQLKSSLLCLLCASA